MAFKQCMDFLIGYGLLITTFISDRHISIASHMRKVLHKITHFFDVWHLKKSETALIPLRLILNDPFSLLHPGFVSVIIIVIICALMLLVVVN